METETEKGQFNKEKKITQKEKKNCSTENTSGFRKDDDFPASERPSTDGGANINFKTKKKKAFNER